MFWVNFKFNDVDCYANPGRSAFTGIGSYQQQLNKIKELRMAYT